MLTSAGPGRGRGRRRAVQACVQVQGVIGLPCPGQLHQQHGQQPLSPSPGPMPGSMPASMGGPGPGLLMAASHLPTGHLPGGPGHPPGAGHLGHPGGHACGAIGPCLGEDSNGPSMPGTGTGTGPHSPAQLYMSP